eukprot:TRINITY_DN7511_c0_g1_i1.p1 TRINITY_DN7511_c0_g1~~TRINITY_DN7511_c0_g1_i1.p1  ORF type:complete len:356 (+),score=40.66 TRINITY_DN7511_c0_g1_i1:70-1137(+)
MEKFFEDVNANITDFGKKIKAFSEKVTERVKNEVRTQVSQDKNRFKEGDFNLDLTYITPRLIAMGTPGSSVVSAWRNDVDDVAKFFNHYHPDHHLIINLTEKMSYDTLKLPRIAHMGWMDHHAPALILLFKVLSTMDDFLNEHPDNVIAVHCKAGRGRTGMTVASYLVLKKQFNAEDAVLYFAQKRSRTYTGIVVPSQERYVSYVEQIVTGKVSWDLLQSPAKLKIIKFLMRPVPNTEFTQKGTTPVIEILRLTENNIQPEVIATVDPNKKYLPEDDVVSIDVSVLVEGDILIRVYQFNKLISKKFIMFRFQFHTSFIRDGFMDVHSATMDGTKNYSLLESSSYPPDFVMRILFE